ncbi:MAG: AraC family transcriptional regulator [Eubacteriales bacterium]|nr:AraC family transcriptional regulator [Eubacteriales bacterium]
MVDQAGIRMAQGNRIACERISGVNDNMSKSHYHDYFEIYFLESGERIHMIEDSMFQMQAGELILFSPYTMHHSFGEKDVPFKRVVLYFHKSEVDSAELLTALENGSGLYCPKEKDSQIIGRILNELLHEQETPSAFRQTSEHALLNLLLVFLMHNSIRQQSEKMDMINRIDTVISYIHNHYAEEISLEQLAQMFYISPYYLCREFKRCTNRTIIQYINITRIMNAQRKFMETDKNVTQISKETGFSNVTHFNRVFKSVTGTTPSGFKKTLHMETQ